jgi:hypothetical protein
MKTLHLLAMLCIGVISTAQKADTIKIDASNVNTSALKSGVHQYLVYFRNGKDSSRVNYQFWTREIEFTDFAGKKAVRIKQVWEENKSVIHTVNSYCDRKDFSPLYHESWWKNRGSSVFDFTKKTAAINGSLITEADTTRARKKMFSAYGKALGQFVLNWHLDLETFPLLPYKEGVTFLINFYDPGFPDPAWQAYRVIGSAKLNGYGDQPIDCWLLSHESKNNKETFWISKKTKEVLKLEQQFGERYRYKVKLGFVVP